jgi:hypothetical protein
MLATIRDDAQHVSQLFIKTTQEVSYKLPSTLKEACAELEALRETLGPIVALCDQFSKWGMFYGKKEALKNELEVKQQMHKDGPYTRLEESVCYLKTKAECQYLHAVSKMLDGAVSKKKQELEMVTQELELTKQKLQAQRFSGHKSSLSPLASKSRLVDDPELYSYDHVYLDCAWPMSKSNGRPQRQYSSGCGMKTATNNSHNDDWGCDKDTDAVS